LKKIHWSKQRVLLKKMCIHLKGECYENFPEHPKWTRMNAWIDKRTCFWKHWFDLNKENESWALVSHDHKKLDAWVSTWVHAWPVLHKISKIIIVAWDIPLSLNRWPNQRALTYIMSNRSTSLKPRSQLTINLDLGWECPSLPSEENKKRKKKESSRSKIGRKQKKKKVSDQRSEENKRKIPYQRLEENERNIQKGLWTRQYMNNTKLSQANKKRKETTWSGHLPLIANQNPVHRWLSHPPLNKNRKGKGQNTQIQISHQKHHSRKIPIDSWSRM